MPKQLTVAVTSLVRFAFVNSRTESNPAGSFGLSTNAGGLVNGDALTPGQTAPTPAGSNETAGPMSYTLLPSAVTFSQGSASNYALNFSAGQLLVMPLPPALNTSLAGNFSDADIQQGRNELDRAASGTRNVLPQDAPSTPAAAGPVPTLTDAQIAMLLSGDGQRITLPELQKMPLIVFDPQLRRQMQAGDAGR